MQIVKSKMQLDNYSCLFKKVVTTPRQHPIEFDHLILDEMYSYEVSKACYIYIFTAVGITDMGYRQVYAHVFKSNNARSLRAFLKRIPPSIHYYSDGAGMYSKVLGGRVLSEKNVWTNLVESFNSQLRHYCSSLVRRTCECPKSIEALQKSIQTILAIKFNKLTKVDYFVMQNLSPT